MPFWPPMLRKRSYFVKNVSPLLPGLECSYGKTFIPVGNFHLFETRKAFHYQKKNSKPLTFGKGVKCQRRFTLSSYKITSVLHSSTFLDDFPSVQVIF